MPRLIGDQLEQHEPKLARVEDAPASTSAATLTRFAMPAVTGTAKAAPAEMMPMALFAMMTMKSSHRMYLVMI
jgi:hypothetical protein